MYVNWRMGIVVLIPYTCTCTSMRSNRTKMSNVGKMGRLTMLS